MVYPASVTESLNEAIVYGLLLRCDLHFLFDPNDLSISLDDSRMGTPYWMFHGKTIRVKVDESYIGSKYLKQRWDGTK